MRTIFLALLTAAAVAIAPVAALAGRGAGVGSRAPEFDNGAVTAKDKPFRIKALRGQWVVVTFGASWCKPCKAELPAWDQLAKQYKGKVTFVAVNIDNKRERGEKFVAKLKLRNMVIVYSPEDSTSTADNYVGGDDPKFPTTFVIDPKGVIRHVHPTYSKGDEKKLAKTLDRLLGAKR